MTLDNLILWWPAFAITLILFIAIPYIIRAFVNWGREAVPIEGDDDAAKAARDDEEKKMKHTWKMACKLRNLLVGIWALGLVIFLIRVYNTNPLEEDSLPNAVKNNPTLIPEVPTNVVRAETNARKEKERANEESEEAVNSFLEKVKASQKEPAEDEE